MGKWTRAGKYDQNAIQTDTGSHGQIPHQNQLMCTTKYVNHTKHEENDKKKMLKKKKIGWNEEKKNLKAKSNPKPMR